MNFTDWLRQKYDEWERRTGGNRADFATYLGVPSTSLSNWLNTGARPRVDSIRLLADKLGGEVYDVLGLRRPEESNAALDLIDQEMLYVFDRLTDEEQEELLAYARMRLERQNSKNAPAKSISKNRTASQSD